jgi:thioredoxin-dependent peroxiredoxin
MNIGDTLPNFTLKDQMGETFSSRAYKGMSPLVIFFYPKDFTPGCTLQACDFRDSLEDFKELGAEVIGISSDSQKIHHSFSQRFQLNFRILSDTDKKVQKLFDVKSSLFGILPGRETFVFNKEGVLIHQFRSFNAGSHKKEALKYLQKS